MKSSKINLPSNKWFPIRGRTDFPYLDFEYVPEIFEEKYLEKLRSKLQYLQFTTAVLKEGESDGAYAWFSDKGDWNYVPKVNQQNYLFPRAWPEWLRNAGLKIVKHMDQFNKQQQWNTCLVSYERSGSMMAYDRDLWNDANGYIVIVFIPASREFSMADAVATLNAKPVASCNPDGKREFELGCLPGSVVVLKGEETLKNWDFIFSSSSGGGGQRKYYSLSFRCVFPLNVAEQNQQRPILVSRDTLRLQKTIIPSLEMTIDISNLGTRVEWEQQEEEEEEYDDDHLFTIPLDNIYEAPEEEEVAAPTPPPKRKAAPPKSKKRFITKSSQLLEIQESRKKKK